MFLQKSNNKVKFKLKKKWRFWRVFKRFFLRRKKKIFFYKSKWFFSQKRIIWHQMCVLYGSKVKKLNYKKNQTKLLFGVKFFEVLSFLEMRFDILITRMGLVNNILEATKLISQKNITINGTYKKKYYLIRINDVICRKWVLFNFKKRMNLYKFKRFFWRRWSKRHKKYNLIFKRFWGSKKNLTLNYLEINYKLLGGVLLRKPMFGEILLENQTRMLSVRLFKKIYFLY